MLMTKPTDELAARLDVFAERVAAYNLPNGSELAAIVREAIANVAEVPDQDAARHLLEEFLDTLEWMLSGARPH
jgi:hypothetical protein